MRRYNPNGFKPRSIRKQEDKTKRNIILSSIIGIVLILVAIFWIIPALIGSLSIFNQFKNTPKERPVTEDVTLAPPVLNIPYDATSSAAINISGYAVPNSKVEIYVDGDLKTTTSTGSDGSFLTPQIALTLGTNNITGKTIDENNKESLSSKNIKVVYTNEKPTLEISEPQDNQTFQGERRIKISGKTEPDNKVSVNDSTIIVNNDGTFNTLVSLNDGENTIAIVASNLVGNSTRVERKVNFTP